MINTINRELADKVKDYAKLYCGLIDPVITYLGSSTGNYFVKVSKDKNSNNFFELYIDPNSLKLDAVYELNKLY